MKSQHSAGPLAIDLDAHEVTIDGYPIHLTRAEFILLATLAQYPRRACSREYLVQVLTKSEWVSDTHALDTVVCRLRHKLGETGTQPRRVVTVHGYGYRFEPDSAPNLATALANNSQTFAGNLEAQSAFVVAARDRTIVWASDNFEHLLGWKPIDIHGTALYQLMHPDDRPLAMAAGADLDAGFPAAIALRFRTASQGYRLVEAIARPILADTATMVACLGEFRLATSDMMIRLPPLEPIRVTTTSTAHLG